MLPFLMTGGIFFFLLGLSLVGVGSYDKKDVDMIGAGLTITLLSILIFVSLFIGYGVFS